jgi:hypothetical protein
MLKLDPESEACFEDMSRVIAEEIGVRVALGQSEPTPENIKTWAELAADQLLHEFIVRPRPNDSPRYKVVDG